MFRKSGELARACDVVNDVVARRDGAAFEPAMERLVRAIRKARAAELADAVERLTPALDRVALSGGGALAQVVGAIAEENLSVLPVLVRRAAEAMEEAARFAALHREAIGEPPGSDFEPAIEPTLERVREAAPKMGLTGDEAVALAWTWFSGNDWVQPVLYLAQRKDVRVALPERERLTRVTTASTELLDTASWLLGLLQVLDDEPLIVLHRGTGRGYRVTISGVGDNFQLSTLLAARLMGPEAQGLLPGVPPTKAMIAAASDGEQEIRGGLVGQFNLVGADGQWIWNEGRPADIPVQDGVRVVVLDPLPYSRSWNSGRLYSRMSPTVTVDGPLEPAEAEAWLAKVAPANPTGL